MDVMWVETLEDINFKGIRRIMVKVLSIREIMRTKDHRGFLFLLRHIYNFISEYNFTT